MLSITQTIKFRLSLINFALAHGVTCAARKFHVSRQYIYRWKNRFDGSFASLFDRSRRPHHHPNQHTPQEITLISNLYRRNPNAGLVVFWVKLRVCGYSRSISGLYRFLHKHGLKQLMPPNPKYIAKPYEPMSFPGERIQVDVKVEPSVCIKEPTALVKHFYQYTAIDEYSHWRYVETRVLILPQFLMSIFLRLSLCLLSVFKLTMDRNLPTVLLPGRINLLFSSVFLKSMVYTINLFGLILRGITARWSAATGKITRGFM